MKIILLTEFFPKNIGKTFTGGVEARVYYLSRYLEINHAVSVWSITEGYAFNNLSLFFKRIYFFFCQLTKIIRFKEKVDLVEGTNATTFLLAYLLARRSGAKAVAWVPDVLGWSGITKVNFVSGLAIAVLEKISFGLNWDRVIALSVETKNKLMKAGVSEGKIEVVYGGAEENSKFKSQNSKFLKKNKPLVICVSRLVKYKRVRDLVWATYFLKQTIPDIKVMIIGDGPEEENLKLEIKNLKLNESVQLLGRISEEEKWDILRHSWIHVLPSEMEGFGLVTLEALISGVPVVNADIPINREILTKNGKTAGGLLYKPGDYAGLSERIELLLKNKKLYNQKIETGRKIARLFSWEKVNAQTEKIYQSLFSN